jgi:hypothetical protein
MRMNIYALKGHKVKVTSESYNNGTKYDKAKVIAHLDVAKEYYTVYFTEVESYTANVELQEFPGIVFNSVNFEDVEEQSAELDRHHPDYFKSYKHHKDETRS